MIIRLTDEHRERYIQMEMLKVWIEGELVADVSERFNDYSLSDFPYGYIKGDYSSDICTEETRISGTEFIAFAELTCLYNVFLGTGRIKFERETVIAFSDAIDAACFMEKWG